MKSVAGIKSPCATRSSGLTRSGITLDKRISGEVVGANAHRGVTDGSAFRIPAARSRTGIPALLIDASLLAGALPIADALRSTSGRGTDKLGQTGAGRGAVEDPTGRIWTAGRGLTGIRGRWRCFFRCNSQRDRAHISATNMIDIERTFGRT